MAVLVYALTASANCRWQFQLLQQPQVQRAKLRQQSLPQLNHLKLFNHCVDHLQAYCKFMVHTAPLHHGYFKERLDSSNRV